MQRLVRRLGCHHRQIHHLVTTQKAVQPVSRWLFGGTAWVFSLVVLGGVTRLTRSGLSMTDWKFTGEKRPKTVRDWQTEFEKYRASPEYRANRSMTLEEFKFIFWMEYGHRMWGRGLGLYFAVPFSYFLYKGYLRTPLIVRIGLLFVAGGSQACVGWWMVQSGLEEPASKHEVARVSPYRLAVHLTTAFGIYSGILWTAMDVAYPKTVAATVETLRLRRKVIPLAGLIGITAVSGAFVAGLEAGHKYNTWPLMEGHLFPPSYWEDISAAVQFHHRCLAVATLGSVWAVWFTTRAVPKALHVLVVSVTGQATLGIITLLNAVPVSLGSAHQAGALTVFSVSLALLHKLKFNRSYLSRKSQYHSRIQNP